MAIKTRLFLLGLFSAVLTGCGAMPATGSITIQQMIINIAATVPSLLQLCTAAAYVLGFLMVFRAVYKFREYGEARTMMSGQSSIWHPVITLTVGCMLIYFVSAYQIGLQTLFGVSKPSPISYSGDENISQELINAVVLIMQLVGCIAFIRGLLLINSAGGHNAQPGSFGKGVTFIIGGILAINIYGSWEAIVNTLVGT